MFRTILICVIGFGLAGPADVSAEPLEAIASAVATKPAVRKRNVRKRNVRKRNVRKRNVRKRNVRERNVRERNARKRRARKRRARKRRARKRNVRKRRVRKRRVRKRRRRRRRRAYRSLPALPKVWNYPPTLAMQRRGRECLRSLTQLNVKWRRGNRIGRVATPVEIRTATLGGVKFVSVHTRRTVMDCHLARAFAMNAPQILALGINQINYTSIHRHSRISRRRVSRHNLGLAVDIRSVGTTKGKTLIVLKHYWRSRTLRKFVRAMKKTKMFRSVLHPGNDYRHRDHFHLEAKMQTTERW